MPLRNASWRASGSRAGDDWALWGRALWRAAAPCVAITLLLGAWIVLPRGATMLPCDLSQDFDNTLLVAVDHANIYSE